MKVTFEAPPTPAGETVIRLSVDEALSLLELLLAARNHGALFSTPIRGFAISLAYAIKRIDPQK